VKKRKVRSPRKTEVVAVIDQNQPTLLMWKWTEFELDSFVQVWKRRTGQGRRRGGEWRRTTQERIHSAFVMFESQY
jgi:hypothetical protein